MAFTDRPLMARDAGASLPVGGADSVADPNVVVQDLPTAAPVDLLLTEVAELGRSSDGPGVYEA